MDVSSDQDSSEGSDADSDMDRLEQEQGLAWTKAVKVTDSDRKTKTGRTVTRTVTKDQDGQ